VTSLPNIAEPPAARLVLGTAQLGFEYGIANRNGRPDFAAASRILEVAWKGGVRLLDTAQAYGESEDVIARFLENHPDMRFGVISKLDPEINASDSDAIEVGVRQCREKFGQPLSGVLFHDNAALALLNNEARRAMGRCIESGATTAFGISTYTPENFQAALDEDAIHIIQAPFSVLDRRLSESGLLNRAIQSGKKVFLRSVYLQGLLLMEPKDLPPKLAFATGTIERWRNICLQHSLTPLQGALGYIRSRVADAFIVIGCETASQVDENIAAINGPELHPDFFAAIEALKADDHRTVDPSKWS